MTKIAIFGSAKRDEELTHSEARKASVLGELIGKAFGDKVELFTGACIGLPGIVSSQARRYGVRTVGYSGETNLNDHLANPNYIDPSEIDELKFLDQRVLNGFTERSLRMIKDAEGYVFLGGRTGTMTEYGAAFDETKKPMYLLQGAGGFVDRLNKLRFKKKREKIFSSVKPLDLVRQIDRDFNICNFETDPRFLIVDYRTCFLPGAWRVQCERIIAHGNKGPILNDYPY